MRKFINIKEFDKPRDDEEVTLTMPEVMAIYEAVTGFYTGRFRKHNIQDDAEGNRVHEEMTDILRRLRNEHKD